MLAYNPTTGQTDTEPIQHVWINHDHDLVDVGLVGSVGAQGTQGASAASTSASAASGTGTAPTASASTKAPPRLSHVLRGVVAAGAVALAVTLGSAAPAQATPGTTPVSAPGTATETIHTTANHPWLTADRGWVEAGNLKPGESVVTLSGATETVAWVHVVAGQANYYNLTVAQDHTYAVGNGHTVVHNDCEDLISTAEEAATNAQRPSATSMRVEDAEGNPVALPETTFTSETAVDEGPFQDIIQQERAYGLDHAGGCGERFACGALYEHAGEVRGGYVEMGLWHWNGEGPCSACQRILQRTADDLSVTIHLEADGQPNPIIYEPGW